MKSRYLLPLAFFARLVQADEILGITSVEFPNPNTDPWSCGLTHQTSSVFPPSQSSMVTKPLYLCDPLCLVSRDRMSRAIHSFQGESFQCGVVGDQFIKHVHLAIAVVSWHHKNLTTARVQEMATHLYGDWGVTGNKKSTGGILILLTHSDTGLTRRFAHIMLGPRLRTCLRDLNQSAIDSLETSVTSCDWNARDGCLDSKLEAVISDLATLLHQNEASSQTQTSDWVTFQSMAGYPIVAVGIIAIYMNLTRQGPDLRNTKKGRTARRMHFKKASYYGEESCPGCLETIRILRVMHGTPPRAHHESTPLLSSVTGDTSYRLVCGDDHIPVHVFSCGHCICERCLLFLYANARLPLRCPMCREIIPAEEAEQITTRLMEKKGRTNHNVTLPRGDSFGSTSVSSFDSSVRIFPMASPAIAPPAWPDHLRRVAQPTN